VQFPRLNLKQFIVAAAKSSKAVTESDSELSQLVVRQIEISGEGKVVLEFE
jgi:hypothetical protein